MSRILDIYLHHKYAGKLIQNEVGMLSLSYDIDYVKEGRSAISISLPIQEEPHEGNAVRAFFSGILPDDIVRHRLAKYLGVSEENPFSLLEAIGGECAGALSLYPEGIVPPAERQEDARVLEDQELGEILELLKRRPMLAGDNGLRLSLAGAQDKIAVGLKDGKVAIIEGTSPTSHILKPIIADIKDSVHNELFCMRLAAKVGIKTPDTEIRWLGETPYFLVERYDRIKNNQGLITRLHQEDFCQASGIMPDIKYEREGGPNIAKCHDIINSSSARPAADQLDFLNRIIFNYLIGNADAHGKNFSLLYTGNKPVLAPAYDLLSTAVYENLSSKMAMKIGGKYQADHVFLRHWHKLVPDTAAAKNNLEKQLIKMAKNCQKKALELKEEFEAEAITSSILEDICAVITKRAEHIIKIKRTDVRN